MSQVFDPFKFFSGLTGLTWYLRDWLWYSRCKDSEPIRLIDTFPCLHDKTITTDFDRHYFYQDIWAFKKICESRATEHVDIGSKKEFVGFLTGITKVTFIDIRPLVADLENFESRKGSILEIPYESNSVKSISCLHVAEHIGLGRYGDPLDPLGTKKAAEELQRVLAPGGNLFFSLPVGRPRLCFNAHRIHTVEQVLDYFQGLRLLEFSGIDDNRNFLRKTQRNALDSCDYGCGLFWFTKD